MSKRPFGNGTGLVNLQKSEWFQLIHVDKPHTHIHRRINGESYVIPPLVLPEKVISTVTVDQYVLKALDDGANSSAKRKMVSFTIMNRPIQNAQRRHSKTIKLHFLFPIHTFHFTCDLVRNHQ